jgi:hypothetical protein
MTILKEPILKLCKLYENGVKHDPYTSEFHLSNLFWLRPCRINDGRFQVDPRYG